MQPAGTMTTLQNLTADQLRKAISIKEEIEKLEAELVGITGGAPAPRKGRKRRRMSRAARAAIAAAQRARWAKIKGGEAVPKKRRRMSAAGRARIAAAARARWAKAKAAGKKRL